MSSLETMFSRDNFNNTIQRFCRDLGWKIAGAEDGIIVVELPRGTRRTQMLSLMRYEKGLGFLVPSQASFAKEDDIPPFLPNLLLKRNFELRLGFWGIEQFERGLVFSCMQKAEWPLISAEYIRHVSSELVNECESLEEALVKLNRLKQSYIMKQG